MKPVSEILAKSPGLTELRKAAAPVTRLTAKLLDAAETIRLEPESVEKTFIARELVQCTLPHTNPGNIPIWKRRNGDFTLSVKAGTDEEGLSVGFPYGTIPRLLLFWITTEALRNRTRFERCECGNPQRIELGHSLAAFMRAVGLDPNTGGGKRSDARRLQDQMRRLFKATISFHQKLEDSNRRGERWLDMQVAPEGELWWDPRRPQQDVLWGSYVVLGKYFFDAITAFPVPADMRVLRAIKRSPLALDLYAWATWRVFKLQKSVFIPWEGLMMQVGAEYSDTKEFARKAKAALRKIRTVYPGLKIDWTRCKGGFWLQPSSPSVPSLPAAATRVKSALSS